MPLFDYHCYSCRKDSEILAMRGDVVRCPHCGGDKLQQMIPMVAVKATKGDNAYPYVEHNIMDRPIVINSPDERKGLMKKHGLVDAPRKRGMPGQWV